MIITVRRTVSFTESAIVDIPRAELDKYGTKYFGAEWFPSSADDSIEVRDLLDLMECDGYEIDWPGIEGADAVTIRRNFIDAKV